LTYLNPQYLTSTEELASMLETETNGLRVFDVNVTLVPKATGYAPVSGIDDYMKAHIPGAAFIDLMNDFSDRTSDFGFMLPSPELLESACRAAGIGTDDQVVIYSSGHMMWATRFWWMLYSCGHKNVSVLDGGFAKWQAEDRMVASEKSVYPSGNFSVELNLDRWADKAGVLAAVKASDVCTINALSPGVYSGDAEMSYGRKGHIENSKNVFYADLLDEGCFRNADALRGIFQSKGVLDKPRVISYCGGGISATIDALGLALIGYDNVAIYDGSMGEWARDKELPLILGAD